MNIYGNSGCFGGPETKAPVGDIDEAMDIVDDIVVDEPAVEEPAVVADSESVEDFGKAMLVLGEYLKRIRILTWAVVALAVVVIMREVKD